jgi:hypothetical protein
MDSHSHDAELAQIQSELAKQLLMESTVDMQLGPTGKFPSGKLSEIDEGELRFAVGGYHGKVILNFGAPVHSAGFTPKQARELALALRKWANRVEREGL